MLFQPELLKQLSDVLKHGGHSPAVRIQAGLQLKNALYSKDLVVQEQYKTRWLQFPEDVTDYVKQNVSSGAHNFSGLRAHFWSRIYY